MIKKHYNGSSKSLVCLNIQHKNTIYIPWSTTKKHTQASARVWLLTFQFGWLVLSSQNKS